MNEEDGQTEDEQTHTIQLKQEAKSRNNLKEPPGCAFCGEKEIWDERLNLCHACAKVHYE